MKRKDPTKRTSEERAADEARYQDQVRRLEEMIERYRNLGAARRARRPTSRAEREAARRRFLEAKKTKKLELTPEERAARRRRSEDLDRRLEEMIERYRKINAERREASG